MKKKRTPNKAETVLGSNIKHLRLINKLTPLQLGRKINKKEQEIVKYETGNFVPLTTLEDIAAALGTPIAKKLIRKISTLRKREMASKIEQEELAELYNQALPENIEEDYDYDAQ